jgi:hypothetical protein
MTKRLVIALALLLARKKECPLKRLKGWVEVQQFVAGERGIAPFSTSFVRRGLRATARATELNRWAAVALLELFHRYVEVGEDS